MDTAETTLNVGAAEQLSPLKESCCSCSPRRLGIIVLAFIKLVLSLWLFVLLYQIKFEYDIYGELLWFYNIITWIVLVLDVVDVVIALNVIISICAKNRTIMKMYYLYSICVFGSITFLCCVILYISTMSLVALLIFLFTFFLIFMMQVYLNYLLKKEVMKLESSEQSRSNDPQPHSTSSYINRENHINKETEPVYTHFISEVFSKNEANKCV